MSEFDLAAEMKNESARQQSESGDNGDNTSTADTPATGSDDSAADNAGDTSTQPAAPAASATDNKQNDDNAQAGGSTESPNDFVTRMELISGGAWKSEDDVKNALQRSKEFDTLKAENEALKAKNPFADEFEQKRNELKLAGATKEALKAFEKLNDLGDLKELDPKEAKVMKLVLVDGYSEKIARTKVDREFPIEDAYDDEKEVLEADLNISAKKDVEALEAYKVQIATPNADAALAQVATKAQIESELTPVLQRFTTEASLLNTVNLNGEEGDKAVTLDLKLDDPGKAFIASEIKEYMLAHSLPVTQENYKEAMAHAVKEYNFRNQESIAQKVWSKADAHFKKLYTEKYENVGGLPRGDRNPNAGNSAKDAAMRTFEDKLIGGPLR